MCFHTLQDHIICMDVQMQNKHFVISEVLTQYEESILTHHQ